MEFAFVVDPLVSLKAYKDTSVAMMRALKARGHELFALEQRDVFWNGRDTLGTVRSLTVTHDDFDAETATYRRVRLGWNPVLSGLKTLLETGQPLVIGTAAR